MSLHLFCDQHCSAPTERVVHLTVENAEAILARGNFHPQPTRTVYRNDTPPESPGPVGIVMKGTIRLEKRLVRCCAR